jgi:hypothetical protein
MPQVSFEFLQIASLSRRRHGFDSRTGRQSSFVSRNFSEVAENQTGFGGSTTLTVKISNQLETTLLESLFLIDPALNQNAAAFPGALFFA